MADQPTLTELLRDPGVHISSPTDSMKMCRNAADLIEAYEEYIELLAKSEKTMIGLAYAHGWRCPQELVDRGKELREKIAALQKTTFQ